SITLPPHPRSVLFPYTTLFRSSSSTSTFPEEISDIIRPALFKRPYSHYFKRHRKRRWISFCLLRIGRLNILRRRNSLNTKRWKRSEEHTSELQSRSDLVCRLLL